MRIKEYAISATSHQKPQSFSYYDKAALLILQQYWSCLY